MHIILQDRASELEFFNPFSSKEYVILDRRTLRLKKSLVEAGDFQGI